MTQIESVHLIGADEATVSALLGNVCLPGARFRGIGRLRDIAGTGTHDEREVIELLTSGKRTLEVGLRLSTSSAVSQILYFRDVSHETEVDQMKSEFLSTAAHELRTPMVSIYGFAEVLLNQQLDEASRQEFVEIIFKQSELMASILNELLDLARIEARRGKDFICEPTSVQTLVADVVHEFDPPAGRIARRVRWYGAPAYVHADV